MLSRRSLLRGAAGLGVTTAAAALLPACGSEAKPGAHVDGPLETTTIRLNRSQLSCIAAQALSVEFLKQEGFTEVQLLDIDLREQFVKLASGAFDLHMYPAQLAAARIDADDPS